jgi:septum formation topological specificity factor MinE
MAQDGPSTSSGSIAGTQAFSSRPMPLLRQRSTTTGTERRSLELPALGLKPSPSGSSADEEESLFGSGKDARNASGNSRNGAARPQKPQSGVDIDSQWVEMQNTLGEVEQSGASRGANVFSSGHASALEDLRRAQIALAQAWARSEADDVNGDGDITSGKQSAAGGNADVLASDRAETLNQKSKGNATGNTAKTKLEQETENDIVLARQRRAANDKYFERVSKGVVDVVNKLEAVAEKMRGVEMESKEIWGSEDTIDDDSVI